MANVKIPYALTAAVAIEKRRDNMLSAIARDLPRLSAQQPIDPAATLYVACYGPSLKHTFEELRGKHPLISMSGATKFLAARGIIADYAIEMDPRVSQLVVSLPPVPGVTYLVASCVCPEYFDQLDAAGNRVILWHAVSSNFEDELKWVSEHDVDQFVISTGSTVGLASIHVGGMLGFRRFEIHGMDGSFEGSERHAGVHGGKSQPDDITWAANGVTYRTSKIMSNAVAESVNTAKNFPIITIWHGDGLTQALIRKANLQNACCADETEKRARLAGVVAQVVHLPPMTKAVSFWDAVVGFLKPTDLNELVAQIAVCEARRSRARFDTGTIPFESSVYLRAICRFYEPKVIAEVGTFIGTSAEAMAAERIYTCDNRNACVESRPGLKTYPFTNSTTMLADITEPVDLFFFDGRVQFDDLPHILRLSHAGTVFVFDDYVGQEKGVANVKRMTPIFPNHVLVAPEPGASTLALMVPFMQQRVTR